MRTSVRMMVKVKSATAVGEGRRQQKLRGRGATDRVVALIKFAAQHDSMVIYSKVRVKWEDKRAETKWRLWLR